MDSKEKSQQNKIITVDFSNRKTGNVEIYTEQPKIINHPIIRARRKQLAIKLKINNRWF
jgi:glyoxylate carboligase